MSATIACKQCGATNRLGVLFCTQCGAKLDLTEKNVQRSVKKERKREHREDRGMVGMVSQWIRWLVFAIVLGSMIALVMPAGQIGEMGETQDAERLSQKIEMLRIAILDAQAQQLLVFEKEVNAYLQQAVQGQRAPGGFSYQLKEIRVDLEPDQIKVGFGGNLGPLPLTCTVKGTGQTGPQGWRFVPASVSIGHLPLPKVFRARVQKQLAGVFGGMVEEQQILKRLTLWDPQVDQVRIGTGGRVEP